MITISQCFISNILLSSPLCHCWPPQRWDSCVSPSPQGWTSHCTAACCTPAQETWEFNSGLVLADEYYLDIIWPPPSCPPLLILCMWGRADPAPREEDRRDLPAFPFRSITTSSRSSVPSSAACCRVQMLETLQWIINAVPDDVTFQISLRMIAAGSAPWCDRLAVCLYQCESKDTSGPAGH